MTEAIAAPSNDTSTLQSTSRFTPRITVEDGNYERVGDFSFGAGEKQLIHDPNTGLTLDQARCIRNMEINAEYVIRAVLERDGLRIDRNDNWIRVMNRCKKNLYEIYRYKDGETTQFHLFRKGRLFARVTPMLDKDLRCFCRVESC